MISGDLYHDDVRLPHEASCLLRDLGDVLGVVFIDLRPLVFRIHESHLSGSNQLRYRLVPRPARHRITQGIDAAAKIYEIVNENTFVLTIVREDFSTEQHDLFQLLGGCHAEASAPESASATCTSSRVSPLAPSM